MVRGFQSYHPFILLIYYVLAIMSLMLYQHPVFLLEAVCIVIAMNISLDGGKRLKKWKWMLVVMFVLSFILTPLFNRRGNHILFYFMGNQVMLESVIQGIMIGLTLFCIIAIFVTWDIVITADKFLFLFAKWFPQWALLIMISMRYVPLLRRRLTEIEQIQEVKGNSIRGGTIRKRAGNGMLLMQTLLTWSLEESIQTADSMSARGFGLKKRSRYNPFNMQHKDVFGLVFLLLTGSLVLFGWWLGDGVLELLPVLEPVWLGGREWVYAVLFPLLLGFPVWVDGKEILKWKYYQHNK